MNDMFKREEIIWCAGLLEGEGCFGIAKPKSSKRQNRAYITCNSTDEDVILSLKKFLNVGHVRGPYQPKYKNGCKPYWEYKIDVQEDVYAICVVLYPWLHSRRKEKVLNVIKTSLHNMKNQYRSFRHYSFVSPKGEKVVGRNLMRLCRERNLNNGAMYQVLNGKKDQYKGWRLC